ncbi:hypothetical protein GCM10009834_29200 [Streptomonospora arabica]|uniref:Uncharacterized protein n=1 Tax=Streptomonospora halophila TaxID=427369 RepID=A0ABP9GDC3_9ACTN
MQQGHSNAAACRAATTDIRTRNRTGAKRCDRRSAENDGRRRGTTRHHGGTASRPACPQAAKPVLCARSRSGVLVSCRNPNARACPASAGSPQVSTGW